MPCMSVHKNMLNISMLVLIVFILIYIAFA